MLLAEIKGHILPAVSHDEDYLTSAVFGHLRYVPPVAFWQNFLKRAVTLPINGRQESFEAVISSFGIDFSQYDTLDIEFWPDHPTHGQPEMAMCFRGKQRTLVVFVEVKLDSPKSGRGKKDQLARYLQIADDLPNVTPRLPQDSVSLVIYLTPRESADEVAESLQVYGDTAETRKRLLRVQWQDMNDAIDESIRSFEGTNRMILSDVRRFLKGRGLEYFNGFGAVPGLFDLRELDGPFYNQVKEISKVS